MTLKRIQSQSIYARPKGRKKKYSGKSRRQEYADNINKDLPLSEVWFQSKWKLDFPDHKLNVYQDKYNYPFGSYIPDVINLGYKYIIEIDGTIHETPEQKLKDLKKDSYYYKRGYKVFRIKAYDNEAYELLKNNIYILRTSRQ